jgi:hypothetical protein
MPKYNLIGRQVLTGVVIILISTLLMGSYNTYSDIIANTDHRISSVIYEEKLDKISESLIRIETNQTILLNKYDNDVNK